MIENSSRISDVSSDRNRRNTRWDIDNAFKNYAFMLISQGGLAVVSFLTTFLLVKNLGIEEYGQIAVFISAAQLMQVFLWWTANAMARFGVEEFVKTGLISVSFWTRTLILIVNILLLIGFAFFWLPLISQSFKLPEDSLLTFLFYLTIGSISMHLIFALQATKLMKEQGFLQMFEKLISFLLICLLLIFGSLSRNLTLLIFTFSPVIIILICVFLIRGFIDWNPRKVAFSSKTFKKFLVFSIPIPLYSLLNPLTLNFVGTLFIVNYHTKTDLGLYTVATQISGLLMMIPTVLGSLLMPVFVTSETETGDNSLAKVYFRQILPLFSLLLALFSTVFIFSVCLLVPYFGEKYLGISLVLWILTAGGIISSPVLMGFFPFLFSKSSTWLALTASFFSSVTLILMSFLLVPEFGTVGSAWAMVISLAINSFIFEIITNKKLSLGFPKTLFVAIPNICGALAFTFGFNMFICLLIVLSGLTVVVFSDKSSYISALEKLKARFKH